MKIRWEKTKEEKGILVAFDKSMQPLILWWYKNLRKYSSLPIAFINLGNISKNMKTWCKSNGYYFECEKYVLHFKNIEVPIENQKKWFNLVKTDVTDIRPYWFTKPIAMMNTPFEKTLYLDIDCELISSIDEIFSYLSENQIGLCEDQSENNFLNNLNPIKKVFNSGVVIYKSKSQIIQKWAELSFKCSQDFFGDQDLLSHLIHEYKYSPKIMPLCWNWPAPWREDPDTKICHWFGNNKIKIIEKIQKDSELIDNIKQLF